MWLLAYADLVLISTNFAAGIVFNTFLSIKFLGEKLMWKYDLAAFALICLGGILIGLIANTDEKLFTADQMKELLLAGRTVTYLLVALGSIITTNIYLHIFLRAVAKFDEDLKSWAKQQMRLEYLEAP